MEKKMQIYMCSSRLLIISMIVNNKFMDNKNQEKIRIK